MKRVSVTPIGKVLESYFSEMGLEDKMSEQRLLDAVPGVLGQFIYKFVTSTYVRDGVLHLRVNNSILRGELNMQRTVLRDKLNGAVSADKMIIKDVIIS
ncbi:MAG: DUF721 domain-containing protein [Paludibacteraceae bacterium]|nr:DUF721 domain-containing protein [Paludibacteraceae bacterium]